MSNRGVSLSTMEFPFDTARAIMSMLYYGTPEKFPNVNMIFSHAGGAMPYLAGRTAVLSQRNRHSSSAAISSCRRCGISITT